MASHHSAGTTCFIPSAQPMGSNPSPVGSGRLPSTTAWGLPVCLPRPPAGYPNRARYSEQTSHRNRTLTNRHQAPRIGGPGGVLGIPDEPPNVVPRSQDPKRPLRSPKSHAKTKTLYLGLSSGSPTSPTQRICTESPEPHPGRVFIGEGQEAGLPILGVNRLDIFQVRGSWHTGIGFYSTVSWP
jgi:hypothetical protein